LKSIEMGRLAMSDPSVLENHLAHGFDEVFHSELLELIGLVSELHKAHLDHEELSRECLERFNILLHYFQ
tara:strand:+ start:288 stop:497 length:210 start_codon:yes stop_codon:yes gene_type:complete